VNQIKLLLISGILLPMLPGVVPAVAASDVAVVVQRDLPVDELTFAELRKILMGERQFWPSNVRVTLLIRAPAAHERDVVIKTILQMTEAQFRQYWISKVFRAESATSPNTVDTNEIAAALVSNIPVSIAFIESTQVPKNLKVLRIDGRLPGEKGYPFN